MKTFILVNSPIFWESTNSNEDSLPPLGQGYIATQLDNYGFSVQLIDCVKNQISVNDIIQKINNTLPDFVGINIFTQNFEMVKYIVEQLKPNIEIFIGGQAVKFLYKDILEWNTQNLCNIIIGEGELIIPEICLNSCRETPCFFKNNKKVFKVDKNSLYFPKDISSLKINRKFFKNEVINNHYNEKEVAIITSRGCLFNCAFCGGANSLNKDSYPRIRSIESISNEINDLIELYPNIQSIRILDDLFLRSPKSFDMAIEIFTLFKKLHWRGMAHILTIKGLENKLRDLRISGCKELFVGIESGSDKMRKKINKLGSRIDVLNISKTILEEGIDLKGYFILGFPQETKQDFDETYDLAFKIKNFSKSSKGTFRTSVFQFRPYHGTALYNEIITSGQAISNCVPNTEISKKIGRNLFNFTSGNYSKESDEALNKAIIKLQSL